MLISNWELTLTVKYLLFLYGPNTSSLGFIVIRSLSESAVGSIVIINSSKGELETCTRIGMEV